MADIKYDEFCDITDKVCPLTFVKAKVALEELEKGQNVPRSMKEDGQMVLKLEKNDDGTYTMYVRKDSE